MPPKLPKLRLRQRLLVRFKSHTQGCLAEVRWNLQEPVRSVRFQVTAPGFVCTMFIYVHQSASYASNLGRHDGCTKFCSKKLTWSALAEAAQSHMPPCSPADQPKSESEGKHVVPTWWTCHCSLSLRLQLALPTRPRPAVWCKVSAFVPVWCCTKHQSWHLACSIVRASALVSFSEISACPCLFQPMTPYLCVWSPKISQEQKIPKKSFHWPFASRIHRAASASFENPRRSRAPASYIFLYQ